MFPQIPFARVNWLVSSFLIGTLFLSVTAVPLYLWFFGIDWFQIALFFTMLGACGFLVRAASLSRSATTGSFLT
jgi:stearoyl-CoA desaturase (delta-9 desaturase)